MSFESTWGEALKATSDILGEDDFEEVQRFRSAEHLLQEIQNLQRSCLRNTIARMLANMRPNIEHLQTFATFLVLATGSSSISLACLWGIIYLLIDLGSKSDDALREVSKYFNDLAENIELFEAYRASIDLDPELVERFFGLLVDLVLAGAGAIKYFRKNDVTRALALPAWRGIDREFAQSVQNFSGRIKHLRRLVKAQEMRLRQEAMLQSLKSYNLNAAAHETAKIPYYQLPFSRNPSFFGRDATLEMIRQSLEPAGENASLRSVALWGTGGIGKTQVALEYANLQIRRGCQVVLWIPAQSEAKIATALVAAAESVQPPGYADDLSADKKRLVMWSWLQTTETSWLIIFDNVDDNALLDPIWPTTGNGQILVTCRSELIALSPAADAIEIGSFSPQEGGQLLIRLARKRNVSASDVQIAEELSSMLGGLALAIEITASQIFVRKKTITQFLPYFKANKRVLRVPPRYAARNPYYSETLLTVWKTAFDGLTENSAALLALICFFAPDDIPRDMISTAAHIPGTWDFLSDTEQYEEAQAQLLLLSLIKINEEKGYMSLHRLAQEAYYDCMTEAVRRDTFVVAYKLLAAAFPKREMRRQMYLVWMECDLLMPHIEMAFDKYGELHHSGLNVQDPALDTMMADATWYCSEISSLSLGEKIGQRATENCADKWSLGYAYLCESLATIHHRRGWYRDAHTLFLRALEIRQNNSTTTEPELADSYSAVGLALFGLFRSEEAITFVNKALEISYAAPKELRHTFNIDRYLRNRSRPLAALQNFEAAKKDVQVCEAFQTEVYGPDSHFHGETAYILGKIAATEGDYGLAMQHLQRAYDLQYVGKPTHQSVASALYHQGLVSVRQSSSDASKSLAALRYFQRALAITQFNEARRGDEGESARVKWQMSKILEQSGRTDDAANYRASALKVKRELEGSGLHPTAPDAEQSWDCFSDLVDR